MSLKIGGFTTLLHVFDMPRALAFYRDLLGFQVDGDVPSDDKCDWVTLKLNGSELMLNTAYEADERPQVADPARVAAHSDVILYFDCEDIDAAYTHLRQRDIAANEPAMSWYGMKQLYLRDPDGYEICLQHPVARTEG
jgi:uncharacterized glyoxalase superfamily protein PhnB